MARSPRLPLTRAVRLFGALANEGRLRLLLGLAGKEEWSVQEIGEALGESPTKVSNRLRVLRLAGVVRARRQGQQVFYRLDGPFVRVLLRMIE